MTTIALYFGTVTGNTADAAELIRDAFESLGESIVVLDVDEVGHDGLDEFEYLILGASTWDIGEIAYSWEDHLDALKEIDFSDKRVALFGLGDALGYPDTFVDAIGILGEIVLERGGTLVGFVPAAGYEFEDSRALMGDPQKGELMGLALDEDNESEKTPERIHAWVKQIYQEFGLGQ